MFIAPKCHPVPPFNVMMHLVLRAHGHDVVLFRRTPKHQLSVIYLTSIVNTAGTVQTLLLTFITQRPPPHHLTPPEKCPVRMGHSTASNITNIYVVRRTELFNITTTSLVATHNTLHDCTVHIHTTDICIYILNAKCITIHCVSMGWQ